MKTKNIALPQSSGLKEMFAKDATYSQRYQKLVQHSENLTPGQLSQMYPNEYNSWRNRKKYSKDQKIPWFQGMTEFSGFLVVNGPIPQPHWTLDRINPKGGYLPENLRWASKATQSQNRTNAHSVEWNGTQLTLHEVAQRANRSYDAVRMGIKRHGNYYVAALLSAPQSPGGIWAEVNLWQFPDNCRKEVEKLYSRRRVGKWYKPRFFIELIAFELKKRRTQLKSNESAEVKAEVEADIAALTPLLNETQAYIDDINERLYKMRCELQAPKLLFVSANSQDLLQPSDLDPDYYLKPNTGDVPWATYPKEVDPVFCLFPGFGNQS